MAGLNKVMIIGNLGRDPEVSYTQGGVAVCKITVATSESWTDKVSGEKKEKTEWHRISLFGKQAETVNQYMKKGSQIYVEGRLQTSQYEKNGETRYSTDIIANNFQFIGSKSDNQNTGQQQPSQGYQQPQGGFQQQQPQNSNNHQDFSQAPPDDQIPFSCNIV